MKPSSSFYERRARRSRRKREPDHGHRRRHNVPLPSEIVAACAGLLRPTDPDAFAIRTRTWMWQQMLVVIALQYLGGRTSREIAEDTGMPLRMVAKRRERTYLHFPQTMLDQWLAAVDNAVRVRRLQPAGWTGQMRSLIRDECRWLGFVLMLSPGTSEWTLEDLD